MGAACNGTFPQRINSKDNVHVCVCLDQADDALACLKTTGEGIPAHRQISASQKLHCNRHAKQVGTHWYT